MIRRCTEADFEAIYAIVNQAAQAYRGVIPPDRWHDPYMPREELSREIAAGVIFSGFERDGVLEGVMGLQPVKDVALIRHAYVRPEAQRSGVGGGLLAALRAETARPILIGTWAAAAWAVRFYRKHGFTLVEGDAKNELLRTYWNVPPRQIETSVVLADDRWLSRRQPNTAPPL